MFFLLSRRGFTRPRLPVRWSSPPLNMLSFSRRMCRSVVVDVLFLLHRDTSMWLPEQASLSVSLVLGLRMKRWVALPVEIVTFDLYFMFKKSCYHWGSVKSLRRAFLECKLSPIGWHVLTGNMKLKKHLCRWPSCPADWWSPPWRITHPPPRSECLWSLAVVMRPLRTRGSPTSSDWPPAWYDAAVNPKCFWNIYSAMYPPDLCKKCWSKRQRDTKLCHWCLIYLTTVLLENAQLFILNV